MFKVVIRRDGIDLETNHADTIDGAKAIGDQAIETGKADSVRIIDVDGSGTEVAAMDLDHSWDR